MTTLFWILLLAPIAIITLVWVLYPVIVLVKEFFKMLSEMI